MLYTVGYRGWTIWRENDREQFRVEGMSDTDPTSPTPDPEEEGPRGDEGEPGMGEDPEPIPEPAAKPAKHRIKFNGKYLDEV
jgi:hypothetical protein